MSNAFNKTVCHFQVKMWPVVNFTALLKIDATQNKISVKIMEKIYGGISAAC